MSQFVAIRVDASDHIGSGHLVRCATLAEALVQRGAEVLFLCRRLPDAQHHFLSERGYEVRMLPVREASGTIDDLSHATWLGTTQDIDASDTLAAMNGRKADWMIVDHYALDFRWESAMRHSARRIMVIDDLADRIHDCDVLLDQNLRDAATDRYAALVPPHCRLLLGPHYALLRKEFEKKASSSLPRNDEVRRLLIFFGGMDADNYTGRVLNALLPQIRTQAIVVDVVIGAAHPARSTIERLCTQRKIACHVQTDHMAELMSAADLAIGAGGVAMWERCCVGLPALAFATAANQVEQVDSAARAALLCAPDVQGNVEDTVLLHLPLLLSNARLRHAISVAGMRAVDGRGTARVCRALGLTSVRVREACRDDVDALFAWRNHADIRVVSRNQAPIDYVTHNHWLTSVLSDTNRHLLIGECNGAAVGVVRFDVADNEAEVSIYRVPGAVLSATGGDLLAAAEQWLLAHSPSVRKICAEVVGGNEPSRHMFISAGYVPASVHLVKQVHSYG